MEAKTSRPRVIAAMPTRGNCRAEAAQAHFALATNGKCDIIPCMGVNPSLLTLNFNKSWAYALTMAKQGIGDYFLLHHDDIAPQQNGYVDTMVKIMRDTGAAALSVVQAIKDNRKVTSTAIDDGDYWAPRKITLAEMGKLPVTFCERDTQEIAKGPLLVNTGLLMVDLSRREWYETVMMGREECLKFYFTIMDRIQVYGEEYKACVRSEDWEFSRMCNDAGLPIYATYTIPCDHWGDMKFGNQPPKKPVMIGGNEHYFHTIPGWFEWPDVYRAAIERCSERGTIVEVGCWEGKGLAFLLHEAKKSGKHIQIIGIDHWKGNSNEPEMMEYAKQNDIRRLCFKNCAKSGYSEWKLVTGDSVDAAIIPAIAMGTFTDGSIDFLFLDGEVSTKFVMDNIAAWLPKIKKGGVLAGSNADEVPVVAALRCSLPDFETRGQCWWFEVK